MDVDVVIAWVDGNDPEQRAKREKYLSGKHEERYDDIAGDERYVENGELKFCVASILRHAPFVRNIFIITDSQNPRIDGFIEKNFPNSSKKIRIIDHAEIFRGYEQYLPVFNSLAIETMMWRIEDLSERFVYFNDDVVLLHDIEPTDWHTYEGVPVCYAGSFPSLWARVLRWIKPRRHGHKPFGFKDSMLNAADLVMAGWFPKIDHTPHPMIKSRLERIYRSHPEFIEKNIKYKFRNPRQYNPQVLFYLSGANELRSPHGRLLFIKSRKGEDDYVERKIREGEKMGDSLMFGCVNSMESLPEKEKGEIKEWLGKRISVSF